MNRNTETHFAQIPHANIQRSVFDRSSDHKTTLNEGQLVPIYVDEILPGDTLSINLNSLIRMSTPLYPIMDNAFIDFYAFFVPNRLTWEHWEEFCGENKTSYWAQQTEYSVPQVTAPSGGWENGTIADYFGIPTAIEGLSVNALPFRAYGLIYNEWFRDENLQQPQLVSNGDETTAGANSVTDQTAAERGAAPLKIGKMHDYFTSCLPEPQKGPEVTLPLGTTANVITTPITKTHKVENELSWANVGTGTLASNNAYNLAIWQNPTSQGRTNYTEAFTVSGTVQADVLLAPNNLVTDLSTATAATVNQLRQAIAIQHIYESDARGGTRYREILQQHFSVTSPDSRMQIPEYVGGYRMPIQVSQVIQNSSTDNTSPQGNTAAYSLTTGGRGITTKSFTEHGIYMILAAVRVEQSYQQGLEKMWKRSDRFSYYWPELANLGEQAVYNYEIYAQGTNADTEVFGYQEAWADYRYKPSRVSCEMRSNYAESLDAWHYAQYYKSQPLLSSSWIQEGTEAVDRTLAVTSSLSHQFICDFYFNVKHTRPMPVYSIPGLHTL